MFKRAYLLYPPTESEDPFLSTHDLLTCTLLVCYLLLWLPWRKLKCSVGTRRDVDDQALQCFGDSSSAILAVPGPQAKNHSNVFQSVFFAAQLRKANYFILKKPFQCVIHSCDMICSLHFSLNERSSLPIYQRMSLLQSNTSTQGISLSMYMSNVSSTPIVSWNV